MSAELDSDSDKATIDQLICEIEAKERQYQKQQHTELQKKNTEKLQQARLKRQEQREAEEKQRQEIEEDRKQTKAAWAWSDDEDEMWKQ